jgi:hypothetical protein
VVLFFSSSPANIAANAKLASEPGIDVSQIDGLNTFLARRFDATVVHAPT